MILYRVFIKGGGKRLGFLRAEFPSDFIGGIILEFFDFAFFLDDEAKSRALDAASRDSARDFFADDSREVVTNKHIKGLAGLLAFYHRHIYGPRVLDGLFKG